MASWKRVLLEGDVVSPSAGNGIDVTSGGEVSADLKANSGLVIDSTEISLDLDATGIDGTLGVLNGGTGAATLTANGVLIGNGTDAVTSVDMVTKGHILVGDGTGPPSALAVGTNDKILVADSNANNGVKWESIGTLTSSGTVTDVTGDENISVADGTTTPAVTLDAALTSMTSMAGANGSTANQAGTDLIIAGGAGVGTGAGGSILLKTSTVSGTSGTNVSALQTAVTIAGATTGMGDTTVTIHGDLVVNGATSSIDVQTLTVEDASILLADGANSVAAADGAGLTVDTVTATPANHPNFIWKDTNLGVAGWQFKDHGAPASAGSAPMGVAALTKGTVDPTSVIMPTGSMWYNTTTAGGNTKGLYLYLD